MRGFGGQQKGYVDNFRTFYNFVREHQGLKSTPAQKAGLKVKGNWKELLVKAMDK